MPFHDPLKKLKVKTLASDGVIKKDNAHISCQVIYVTSFNKYSDPGPGITMPP